MRIEIAVRTFFHTPWDMDIERQWNARHLYNASLCHLFCELQRIKVIWRAISIHFGHK